MAEATGCVAPLSMARTGETVRVARVRGGEELRRHLASLGFVDGAEVHVVSQAVGNIIVMVKGARLGLDKKTALKIMVA